jgi:hypothetical protein
MKKKVKEIIISLLFITLLSSGTLLLNNNLSASDDKIKITKIDEHTKEIKLYDKVSKISYKGERTKRISTDGYGVYDVYRDELGVQYEFLKNTNKLCFMFKYKEFINEVYISQEEALKIATEFKDKVIVDSNDYIFDKCSKDGNTCYYLYFNKPLSGYKTEDQVVISVSNGEVRGLNAFYQGLFDKYLNKKYDITGTQEKLDNIIKEKVKTGGYQINDKYISKNEKGDLILVNDVSYEFPINDNYRELVKTILE